MRAIASHRGGETLNSWSRQLARAHWRPSRESTPTAIDADAREGGITANPKSKSGQSTSHHAEI